MLHVQEDSLLSGILLTLRRSLNNCAEIAGSESLTSSIVTSFLSAYHPDLLLTELGGHGVAAVYEGLAPGPTVLLRADLDALAVEAGADPSHGLQSHAAHRCGHDGHMTIVAGLAPLLSQRRPAAGRVVLLFQPAEETGEGAQAVIDDPRFALIRPDLAIGLHNLPGYPRHAIVYRNGTFCCASIGMRIDLVGADAHAAEPERACSPARALSLLLTQLPTHSALNSAPFRLVTVTHARLGEESYGVTPGTGVLCATLRSSANSALDQLCGEIESLAQTTAAAEKLGCTIRWIERFPDISNDATLVRALLDCCEREQIQTIEAKTAFRWSDDFGHFASVCPILYFGLGVGEDAARLHQVDYEFPDEVLDDGVRLLAELAYSLAAGAGDEGASGFYREVT